MAHHGVEFVKVGDDLLDLRNRLALGFRQRRDVRFVRGNKLVKGRIEETDGDGIAAERFEETFEVGLGSIFSSAASLSSTVSEQIISRNAPILSGSKNMCSVRQRPMPCAPNAAACFASLGVSALVLTPSALYLSANCMIRPK